MEIRRFPRERNLAGGITINDHVRISARLENLFDKNYEEVLGYGTAEASGYLALNLVY